MDTGTPVHIVEYFGKIHTSKSSGELETYVNTLIKMHSNENPIYLSDCLVNINRGGQHIMLALEDIAFEQSDWPSESRMSWRIKVLCDEYGNQPKPGETIWRKQLKKLKDKDGRLVPSTVITMAKIDGTYEERFIKKTPYVVDDKGCIRCCFSDAVHFLHTYGVHGRTKISMTSKPEYLDTDPDNKDKNKRIHYWRYMEIDNDAYDKLPNLPKKTKV